MGTEAGTGDEGSLEGPVGSQEGGCSRAFPGLSREHSPDHSFLSGSQPSELGESPFLPLKSLRVRRPAQMAALTD